MKRKYLLIISLVLCIMVIIIGSTYAYFNVINTGESSDVIINAKTLAIRYIDGPSITESGILPGTKIVKTFAVTNEGDDDVYYSIKLIDVINELVASSDLVYDLEGDNGVNYSSQLYPSYDKTITDFILIGALETQNYTLTIEYINQGYVQNEDMDKLIAGTINIGVASGKMVSRLSSSELLNINALITEYEGLVGEGSESSPYLIESALDLIYFNQKAHNNENIIGLTPQRELNDIDLPALTSVYKITKNIVLNDPLETSLYEAGTDYYNWLGIGTSDNPFTGKITGDNNISISGIKAVTTGDYSGFINYATDLVMSNIEIKDSYFKSAYNAGAFVGYLSTSQNGSASFTNCINSAEVNGRIYSGGMVGKYNNSSYGPNLSFINCTNNGHIISNSYAGGLIGGSGINNSNSGTITFERNVNNGRVEGTSRASGLGGDMYGYGDAPGQVLVLNNNINNGVIGRSNTSYAGGFLGDNKFALVANNNVNNAEILSSSYAGGLVGRQDNSYVDAEINNGINNGNITGYGAVGGIVGYLAAKDFVLEDSYNTGDIEAIQYGGGIIGRGQDLSLTGTINEVYNTGDINCNNYCGGIIGVDYSTVTLKNSYNIGNITTNVSTTSIGGISGEGLYQIINTYNAGNITSIKDTRANNIGGITGMNTIANFKYENVVNAGTITSKYRSAGILSFGQLSYNGGTLNNVYSLGSVNVTSAEIYDDTKAYSLGCNLDGVNLVDVYILDGIAPYIARTMTSIDPYIISTSPSILSVVNGESKFKADSNNTNHGYPKLIWQE